jgi:hypothetical protein
VHPAYPLVDSSVRKYLIVDIGRYFGGGTQRVIEALTVLTDTKLRGYHELRRRGGPAWPALFSLHSATREAHLHQRLAGIRPTVPIATAARDRLAGRSPAEAIWHVHGRPGPLRRLSELPMPDQVDLAAFDDDANDSIRGSGS